MSRKTAVKVNAMQVFVLLFNTGTDNEGIHTLSVGDRHVVLMFEDEDDATRFGLLLEAQDFLEAGVEAIDREEIEAFCEEAGYGCQLVPTGKLVIPPETNREQTDWQIDGEPGLTEINEGESAIASDPNLDRIRRQLENLLGN